MFLFAKQFSLPACVANVVLALFASCVRICGRFGVLEVLAVLSRLFDFPNPVNDYAARLVAGAVATMTIVIILFDVRWMFGVLAYGFLARVLTGPRLSPLALLATKVVIPLAGGPDKPVPGPPKRFAQAVGVGFSLAALVLMLLGSVVAAKIVVGVLCVFALAESLLGFCAGCFVFNYLMAWGVIPSTVCEACQQYAPSTVDDSVG